MINRRDDLDDVLPRKKRKPVPIELDEEPPKEPLEKRLSLKVKAMIGVGAVGAAFVGVFFLCFLYALTHPKDRGSAPRKGTLVVDASQLGRDYKINPAQADEKYKGKIIRVSLRGKVEQQAGVNYLVGDRSLRSVGPECAIRVSFADRSIPATLVAGVDYTVEGRCDGLDPFDVRLTNCDLIR